MKFKKNLFLILIATGFAFNAFAENPTVIPNKIVSKKLDTNYIKTIKDGDKTWYEINCDYINTDLIVDTYGMYNNKAVGKYYVINNDSTYYEAVRIFDYTTGDLIELPCEGKVAYVDDELIWIKTTLKNVVLSNGTYGTLKDVYKVFDYNGKRVSDIDFISAQNFDKEYIGVYFYRDGIKKTALMDRKGNIVFEIPCTEESHQKGDTLFFKKGLSGKYYVLHKKQYYEFKTARVITEADAKNDKTANTDDFNHNNNFRKYPNLFKASEETAFREKYGSVYSNIVYLGGNRFRVVQKNGSEEKTHIVNGSNKILFTNKKNYTCWNSCVVDNKIFFITLGAATSDSSYSYCGLMDADCNEIIAPDKYLAMDPIDGGFTASKELINEDELNYQCILSTSGKVLKEARIRTGEYTELYTYREGKLKECGHFFAKGPSSVPPHAIMFFSTKDDFINNNISTSFLKTPYKIEYEPDEDKYKNNVYKNYKNLLQKETVPAIIAYDIMQAVKPWDLTAYDFGKAYKYKGKYNSSGQIKYNIDKNGNAIYVKPDIPCTAENTGAQTCLISWKNEWDEVGSYKVSAKRVSDSKITYYTVDQSKNHKTSVSPNDLLGNESYCFMVTAYDKNGNKLLESQKWSKAIKIVKKGYYVNCTGVEYLSSGKTKLYWEKIPGATQVEVSYKVSTIKGNGSKKTVKNQSYYVFDTKKGKDYVFRIRGIGPDGVVTDIEDWKPFTEVPGGNVPR